MKVTVYTAYHKAAARIEGRDIAPIHVGAARSEHVLPNMLRDDSGANISERNEAWCELTALYWAWKNDTDSSHIGLMHYRRLFDVAGQSRTTAVEDQPRQFDIDEWLATADFETLMAEYDIVVPQLHVMGRTVEDNFAKGHNEADWTATREIIHRDHPDYVASFEAVSKGRQIRLGNMLVMSRDLLERYCEWVFDILFKLEDADVDRSAYTPYQSRYIGFIAERLLTVFVYHLQANQPQMRVKETPILNLSKALVTPYIGVKDAPAKGTVNIALAADAAFLPHAAAMLRSVFDHIDQTRPVNVFLLYSDVPASSLQILDVMLNPYPQVTLHALDTSGVFADSYRSGSRAPSNATYNRFLLFSLLPGVQRLLYLDADMIIKRDICELFDVDLGGATLAAVPDWIMTRTLTGPIETVDPSIPDLGQYQRDTLGMTTAQMGRYFNAGLLLFDFAAMKDPCEVGRVLMAEAKSGRYLFRDQDILNRHFKDDYLPLDGRWNVFNSLPATYGKVPKPNHDLAMAARKDPWIIHFADRRHKPWNEDAVMFADEYWSTLARTPFFKMVLRRSNMGGPQSLRHQTNKIVLAGRALADKVPFLRGPLLRIYALFK